VSHGQGSEKPQYRPWLFLKLIIMNWTNVKDRHFAKIIDTEKSYVWESKYDKPFLAAVATYEGWDIEKVILEDGAGLKIYSDNETHPYGWDMTDVAFWCEITDPE